MSFQTKFKKSRLIVHLLTENAPLVVMVYWGLVQKDMRRLICKIGSQKSFG